MGAAAASLVLAAASACDVPTELPELESRWVVPTEDTRFGVAQLLPGEFTVAADSSAFLVDLDPVTFSATLGELCPACALANGLTVPKPPFVGTIQSQVDFPPEVHEVSVESGQVVLEVQNLLGFDPIRPGAGSTGLMTLRVTDDADGDVLSELVLDGDDVAFPSGSTLIRNLDLAPTDVNGSLLATVELDSPLGDSVTVDANASLDVLATPTNIRVTSVSIDVSNESVTLDPVSLDVENISDEVKDAVVSGALELDVVNPFGVAASFDLSITAPSIAPIDRSATISSEAMSTVRLEFTGDEIRSFLGQPDVMVTGTAVVDPAAGIVSLGPGQELVLDSKLDLTLSLGGGS